MKNNPLNFFRDSDTCVCRGAKNKRFNKMTNAIIDTDKTNRLHTEIIDAEDRQKEQAPIIVVD